jgi:plastocyanin domain-containing protein
VLGTGALPRLWRTAELPEGETVRIELTPGEPGEYGFECGMSMLHAKLVAR